MAVDPAFGVNSFNKPKVLSESETLANNILATLFGKKGAYPSMPDFGMEIQSILEEMDETVDPEAIKTELVRQCSHFSQVVQNGEFDVVKTTVEQGGKPVPIIIFKIPTKIKDDYRSLVIGITVSKSVLKYNFTWIQEEQKYGK